MTRTFSTNGARVLANVRASLASGKPMTPERFTVAIGEDPVFHGVVIATRPRGGDVWFQVDVKP